MKLRNKKTGVIVFVEDTSSLEYHSIAELNEDWEDYEEPKEQYYIKENGTIDTCGAIEDDMPDEMLSEMKEIGNYFETREEAEKAVEKLKAWKRLKDKGFKFSKDWVYRYDQPKVENHTYFELVAICEDGVMFDDLDLLFGGEE